MAELLANKWRAYTSFMPNQAMRCGWSKNQQQINMPPTHAGAAVALSSLDADTKG